ncbi:MAG: hypothetical protein RLZZ104_1551, partial [Pseudomonadota bacterium]
TYNSLTILLFGEELAPKEVNAALGISATDSFKKGDSFSKGKHLRKNGMWSLELKREGSSPYDDLRNFADMIPDNFFPLSNIDGVSSARLSLWIDLSDPSSTIELSIDEPDIELMNKLGVQFYLTAFPEIAED